MDLKQLKQIASILNNERIEELEWKEGDFYLRLKRSLGETNIITTVPELKTADEKTVSIGEPQPVPEAVKGPAPGNQYINSPIVGTFYRAPSPKADPYIREGDKVRKGQVLCIIEAMKLMNELEAEFPCEIVKMIAGNAQPVEFGEPLFEVRPL